MSRHRPLKWCVIMILCILSDLFCVGPIINTKKLGYCKMTNQEENYCHRNKRPKRNLKKTQNKSYKTNYLLQKKKYDSKKLLWIPLLPQIIQSPKKILLTYKMQKQESL